MTEQTFKDLTEVDHISLMTYDYTITSFPGPNAPLAWITKTVMDLISPEKRSDKKVTNKIMMGLNFYGHKFLQPGGPSPVVANEYLDTLKKKKDTGRFRWNLKDEEHSFTFEENKVKTSIYYPTLKYLNDRIEFAGSLGLGLSIWDLGQGLNYFYDLL